MSKSVRNCCLNSGKNFRNWKPSEQIACGRNTVTAPERRTQHLRQASNEHRDLSRPEPRPCVKGLRQSQKWSRLSGALKNKEAEILQTHTAVLFQAAVERAAELLRKGEVVALPTET